QFAHRGDGEAAHVEQVGAAQEVQRVVVESRDRGDLAGQSRHVLVHRHRWQPAVREHPVVLREFLGERIVGRVAQDVDERYQPQVTGQRGLLAYSTAVTSVTVAALAVVTADTAVMEGYRRGARRPFPRARPIPRRAPTTRAAAPATAHPSARRSMRASEWALY